MSETRIEVHLLWVLSGGNDLPWVADAATEFTLDEWPTEAAYWEAAKRRLEIPADAVCRVAKIRVTEAEVRDLFGPRDWGARPLENTSPEPAPDVW